ncbi:hypothetical protein HHX47_DHR4001084 [Lentinula edodes]|nr:hypothetical protein HHX47_DHR4001084 [Lentinula edodes]
MKGYPMGKLASNPCINKKDKNTLNEEDWLKVQPLILEPLQQQRTVLVDRAISRRMFLLKEAYGRFQKTYFCQHSAICPTLGDLIVTDGPIKTLIQATPLNHHPASIDSEFSMRSAETLLSSEFASFVHKWRYEKEMDLFRMLCEAVPGTSSGNDLCLATTIFRCNTCSCGIALYYPDVFYHSCTTAYDFRADWETMFETSGIVGVDCATLFFLVPSTPRIPKSSKDGKSGFAVEKKVLDCFKILNTKPWNYNGKGISFYHRASEIARRVLTNDPYLDPSTTTIHHIKTRNLNACCITCSGTSFCWSDLFRHEDVGMHDIVIHWPNTVCDQDVRSDTNKMSFHSKSWVYGSRCKLCLDLLHPDALSGHLLSAHSEFQVDGNWYMDFDSRFPVY